MFKKKSLKVTGNYMKKKKIYIYLYKSDITVSYIETRNRPTIRFVSSTKMKYLYNSS